MKRPNPPSPTRRNVRPRRDSESASSSSSSPSSDTPPTQPSSLSIAETNSSDGPSSSETSSFCSDSSSSSSSSDADADADSDTYNDAAAESEPDLSTHPTPRNGLPQVSSYTDTTGRTTLRAGRKPTMTAPSTLLDKVRRFLPQMEKANAVLEEARVAGTLGARSMEVDEGEEGGGDGGGGMYIEMDLGLGVLEQRDGIGGESEGELGDDESSLEERDVMGKLLGRKKARRVQVEEV